MTTTVHVLLILMATLCVSVSISLMQFLGDSGMKAGAKRTGVMVLVVLLRGCGVFAYFTSWQHIFWH